MSSVVRLAALYRQLDRLQDLTIFVDALPPAFFARERCRNLKSLELSGLQLVPPSVGELAGLTRLALAGNFVSLPESLCDLPLLRSLSLRSSLPEWLRSLVLPQRLGAGPLGRSLEELHLEADGAVVWPPGAAQLRRLRRLELRDPAGLMVQLGAPAALPALTGLRVSGWAPGAMRLAPLLAPQGGLRELSVRALGGGALGRGGLLDLAAAPAPPPDEAARGGAGGAPGRRQPSRYAHLGGLTSLTLEAACTGLAGGEDGGGELQQPPLGGGRQLEHEHEAAAASRERAALSDLFGCLAGLESLELVLRPCAAATGAGGRGNATLPLLHALGQLRGLERLRLDGLRLAGRDERVALGVSLRALPHLRKLELRLAGGSGGCDGSSGAASSCSSSGGGGGGVGASDVPSLDTSDGSCSCGSEGLAMPPGLEQLRIGGECAGEAPLLSADALRRLADGGCEVVVLSGQQG